MKFVLQGLLHGLERWLARGVVCACIVVIWGPPALATTPSKPQKPSATASEALQLSVQKWVAQSRQIRPDQVTVAPLDARIKVRTCERALAMELPFSSAETVRVRCAQPLWQHYVRVSVAGPAPEVPAKAQTQAAPAAKRWVLVAKVPLQRGMVLNESHVSREQLDAASMPVNALEQASELAHTEAVRDVRTGTPLRSQDIRPMVLVKRGQMVLLSVGQAQGFQISARVEALQDGRFGDQIKLKNRDSGRELSGRVLGPNQVSGL